MNMEKNVIRIFVLALEEHLGNILEGRQGEKAKRVKIREEMV